MLIVGGVLSFIGILVLIVANPVIGILVLIVAGLDLFIMKCYEENTTLDILSVINRSTQSKGCTFLPLWKMFEGLSTDGDNAARKVVGFVVIADLSHDDIKTNDKIMNWHPSHGLKTDQRQVTDNSQLQSTIIPVNSANPTQSALPAYPSAPPAYPSVSAPLLTCNVWTEEYDAENKHKYWFNATTAQSSWIKPEGPGVIIRNKDTETGRESLPPSEAPLKYPSGF